MERAQADSDKRRVQVLFFQAPQYCKDLLLDVLLEPELREDMWTRWLQRLVPVPDRDLACGFDPLERLLVLLDKRVEIRNERASPAC